MTKYQTIMNCISEATTTDRLNRIADRLAELHDQGDKTVVRYYREFSNRILSRWFTITHK